MASAIGGCCFSIFQTIGMDSDALDLKFGSSHKFTLAIYIYLNIK